MLLTRTISINESHAIKAIASKAKKPAPRPESRSSLKERRNEGITETRTLLSEAPDEKAESSPNVFRFH